MQVVRVSDRDFEQAVELMLAHDDKRWSLTDCTSFVLMRELEVANAFTFDRNFTEAGFSGLAVERKGRDRPIVAPPGKRPAEGRRPSDSVAPPAGGRERVRGGRRQQPPPPEPHPQPPPDWDGAFSGASFGTIRNPDCSSSWTKSIFAPSKLLGRERIGDDREPVDRDHLVAVARLVERHAERRAGRPAAAGSLRRRRSRGRPAAAAALPAHLEEDPGRPCPASGIG